MGLSSSRLSGGVMQTRYMKQMLEDKEYERVSKLERDKKYKENNRKHKLFKRIIQRNNFRATRDLNRKIDKMLKKTASEYIKTQPIRGAMKDKWEEFRVHGNKGTSNFPRYFRSRVWLALQLPIGVCMTHTINTIELGMVNLSNNFLEEYKRLNKDSLLPQQSVLYFLTRDQNCAKIVAFVAIEGHIFSMILTIDHSLKTPRLTHVMILDTGNFLDKDNMFKFENTKKWLAYILHLMFRQNIEDIYNMIEQVLEKETFNLQECEDGGYCQNWCTYLPYQILVKGEEPEALYRRLIAMNGIKRREIITDFSNKMEEDWEMGRVKIT